MPLVSVVMPSLNQARYIETAIDSVLGQDDYRNVELIVADGGSTDGTISILDRRAKRDPHLRWFSESDTGPANAVNRALAQVRGTIVGWLNSDDVYPSGALRRAVFALQDHPDWVMVYGHGQQIDETGQFISDYPTLPPSATIEQFSQGCFICQPTVFFKRTLILLLGKLDESLKTAFDFDYWLRAFQAFPGRIGFIEAVQGFSRLHNECITLKQRRLVASEGIRLLARYLGHAPKEWLLTYAIESLQNHGAGEEKSKLQSDVVALRQEILQCIDRKEIVELDRELERIFGYRLTSADF